MRHYEVIPSEYQEIFAKMFPVHCEWLVDQEQCMDRITIPIVLYPSCVST